MERRDTAGMRYGWIGISYAAVPGSRVANDMRVTDVVAGGCAGRCIILKIILIRGGILNAVYRISEVFDMQKG